jgi:AcrR family transcriptional regulator
MGTEKLKTEVRKEQIVEAALEVIALHGVRGINMARIARRVGLVPSAIYRHFNGKDEVLDAALSLIEQRLSNNVEIARTEEDGSLERLRRLLKLHVRFIRENRGVLRIIFSDDLYSDRPGRKTDAYRMIRRYLRKVEEIIREGQACGQIRSELNPETLSLLFLGMIQPGAILWNMSDGEFDITRHAERAWRIFSEAIAGGTATDRPTAESDAT